MVLLNRAPQAVKSLSLVTNLAIPDGTLLKELSLDLVWMLGKVVSHAWQLIQGLLTFVSTGQKISSIGDYPLVLTTGTAAWPALKVKQSGHLNLFRSVLWKGSG